MASASLVLLVVLIGFVSAVKIDMCRSDPPIMINFDILKLKGQWYEYARLPNLYQYFTAERCNRQNMTVGEDGIQFTTSFINETSGNEVTFEGRMSANPEKPGRILVDLPAVGLKDYFKVLDAQYDDYVIFYFCGTMWYFKIELAWVLTRESVLSEEKKGRLIEKLKTLTIETDRLVFEKHENC